MSPTEEAEARRQECPLVKRTDRVSARRLHTLFIYISFTTCIRVASTNVYGAWSWKLNRGKRDPRIPNTFLYLLRDLMRAKIGKISSTTNHAEETNYKYKPSENWLANKMQTYLYDRMLSWSCKTLNDRRQRNPADTRWFFHVFEKTIKSNALAIHNSYIALLRKNIERELRKTSHMDRRINYN